jgi:hypothetical protein
MSPMIKRTLPLAALFLAAVSIFPLARGRDAAPPAIDFAGSTPVNISHSASNSAYPLVGADANNAAYVVWLEYLATRTFAFASNKSGSWSAPASFEQVEYVSSEAGFPDFAVTAGGQCHMSWQDGRVTSYDIFHIAYDNGWGATTNVSDANAGGSAYSGIAVNPVDNAAYVVWMDGTGLDSGWNIMLRYRTAAGVWAPMQTLPGGLGYMPKIAFDGTGTAHLTWTTRASGTSAVWYMKNAMPQNPSGWTQPIAIETDTGQDWSLPRIAADKAGNAYFIWLGTSQGADAIMFRKITAAGVLSDKAVVSTAGATASDGAIAVNKTSGVAYVAWIQNGDVFLNSFGTSWSGPQNLTGSAANDAQPSIAVDGSGNIHLAYAEMVGAAWDIMYLGSAGPVAPPPAAKPSPPLGLAVDTSLNATQTLKTNALSWTRNPANASLDIQSYRIYRKSGSADFALLGSVAGSLLTYQDAGLSLTQKYSYALTAFSSANQESDLSDAAAEAATFPPLSPSLETVTNSALFRREKINVVTWAKNPLNNAVTVLQYNIYRKLSTENDSQYQNIASVGAGILEYMDRMLSFTDSFSYYVTTVDTSNKESRPSLVVKEGT